MRIKHLIQCGKLWRTNVLLDLFAIAIAGALISFRGVKIAKVSYCIWMKGTILTRFNYNLKPYWSRHVREISHVQTHSQLNRIIFLTNLIPFLFCKRSFCIFSMFTVTHDKMHIGNNFIKCAARCSVSNGDVTESHYASIHSHGNWFR